MRSISKIIVAVFLLSPLLTVAQNGQFIEWSAVKRLTWDDYLAKPSLTSDAAAITSTALGVEYHLKNSLTYTITCRFSKTTSWGRHKTEYILQHEQGHFDITELFARKLAKELKSYKFNPRNYQEDVGKIYKRVMDEKEEYQNKYDKETDFSRNKQQQVEWLEKIKDELDDLDEFADYGSTIKV
jgi:hydroxymethylpyrimidine pyrophosphatase-like HAD family hydrolase